MLLLVQPLRRFLQVQRHLLAGFLDQRQLLLELLALVLALIESLHCLVELVLQLALKRVFLEFVLVDKVTQLCLRLVTL